MRILAFIILFFISFSTFSKLVEIEIQKSNTFTANNIQLEAVQGYAYFKFDPTHQQNQRIIDLNLAETDNGLVNVKTTFYMIQLADPAARKGTLIEISNRGSKASLRYFNKASGQHTPNKPSDIGDALIQRLGLSVMWVGWQSDVFESDENMWVSLPTAMGTSGMARSDWTVETPTESLGLSHRNSIKTVYKYASNENNIAYLTYRERPNGAKVVVPRNLWEFTEDGLNINGSFTPGIYELVYPTENSIVQGLGFALVRDTAEYLKRPNTTFNSDKVIAFGVSQTGRWLRHFLYQGFNQTEEGMRAFDGMLIHTAGAGRGSFNHRFGQPSRDAHRMSAFFYPTDVFPFTSQAVSHPITGNKDGLLSNLAKEYQPKIFYTNTGYEYWGRAAGLIHTHNGEDVSPLPNERIYHLASGQHFVEREENLLSIESVSNYFQGNPLNFLLNLRANLANLTHWVIDDVPPPASKYPSFESKTLVNINQYQLPSVLSELTKPISPHTAYIYDYGSKWSTGIIEHNPPRILATISPPLPQIDNFGNELGGISHPLIVEPLASFLPWVLRHNAVFAKEEMMDFRGAIKLLPKENILSRYSNWDTYQAKLNKAIDNAISEKTILEEDRDNVLKQGQWLWNKAVVSLKN